VRDSSEFEVQSSAGAYRVRIGAFRDSDHHWDAVIADTRVPSLLAQSDNLIPLEADESAKSLQTVEQLCQMMAAMNLRKNSRVLVVGGGWAQDIATMATSIYHRGIKWDFAPSTLMAMADSCLGGKSSINLGARKNILGNFYPPSAILVDSRYVRTLDASAIVAGLSEAVKIVFARGAVEFRDFLGLDESQMVDPQADYSLVVEHSLRAKKWFVEEDEFDGGVRKLLNFGHTFAHALESATGMQIAHGNAVLVGMLSALEFSGTRQSESIELLSNYCLLLGRHVSGELLTLSRKVDWAVFEASLGADKKGSANEMVFILPNKHGALEVVALPRSAETMSRATASVQKALAMLEEKFR